MISTLRVLIADDEPLARARLRRLLRVEPDVEIVAEAVNGKQVLQRVAQTAPDVLFLDVRMPLLDGFEVLGAMQRGSAGAPVCVFVTAFEHYAPRAFDVYAVDYLVKPFDAERLRRALARVRERCDANASFRSRHGVGARPTELPRPQLPLKIPVPERDGTHFVEARAVEYVEAEGNYVQLYTAESAHLVRATLATIAERLGAEGFVRVHRSRLVRIDSILAVSPLCHGEYCITLKSGRTLTSARRQRARLRAALGM